MSDLRITVARKVLSDRSEVFDVILSTPADLESMTFHAVTEAARS